MATADIHHSVRRRFFEDPFASPFVPALADAKYSSDPWVSALMVWEPSVQLAGQTSPCLSYGITLWLIIKFSVRQDISYRELECLEQANGLVDRAADRKIVDGNLPKNLR
jgi:hypothetical protein